MRKSYYGWVRDLPDQRDRKFSLTQPIALPASVDLRPQMPPVYSQGQLGSCTANAIGAAIQYERHRQNLPDFTPSRLFIYYNEREMEGTVAGDAGAQIRDGIKSVAAVGACDENLWPYVVSAYATKPPQAAYDAAGLDRALDYSSVAKDATQLRSVLAAGWPIAFGFSVYASFESSLVASTGIAPVPTSGEQLLGGHAVLVVGYDDAASRFLVRNSWGAGWGVSGYFWMPYSYVVSELASDFWCIRLVSS